MKSDPTAPLWRAAQVFRLLSCIYALGFQVTVNSELRYPVAGWALFGVLIAWSSACAAAYVQGFGRRRAWVLTEVVVVLALMLSTEWIATDQWVLDNQSLPTTLWATNATISTAILIGPVAGMGTGLLVMAAGAALKGYVHVDLGGNATIVVELAVGLVVGLAAQTARRAHTEFERAARLSAALEERERLSREVHDGAIQVLALVARRGREIGGETAQLGDLAGEQERALRRLVSAADHRPSDDTTAVDLGARLRRCAGDRVSVAVPGEPVLLEMTAADELLAAVTNVLDNVAAHAGPEARAYVLLEDLGDEVTVSVRDDGVGIADGRLAQAQREGRLGISKSIVGRLDSLGGRAELSTAPGAGVEWELTVPRRGRVS